jgi:hypothetical protein
MTASVSTSVGAAVAATIAVAAAITGTVAIPAIAVSAAEPGASPDKDATVKPRRTVISVRRTSVGRITVVAPLTDGGTIVATVPRAYANSERNLGMRIGRWNHQNTKQREIP